MREWAKKDVVRLFELLVEDDNPIYRHPIFRKLLNRDESLVVNQITREANGNLAYRSVDFDVDNLSDNDFWNRINGSKYREILEDNAAIAIFKMAKKNRLTA